MTPPTDTSSRSIVLVALVLMAASLTACGSGAGSQAVPSTTSAISGDRDAGSSSTSSTSTSTTVAATTLVPATDADPRMLVLPGETSVTEARAAAAPTEIDASVLTPDGRTRTYHLFVPENVDTSAGAEPVPLLLAFHGGAGWGEQFQSTAGFAQLAETNGFIVAFPDGVGAGGDETRNRTWNAGICCGAAERGDVDDVTFVRMIIDEVEADHPIDPDRVFATGHSNGAMISYRLACELSDRIVAIAVQSGALTVPDCSPAEPVSVLSIHGTADTNVPIGGGVGADSAAGVDFPPPMDATEAFAATDGCSTEHEVTTSVENPDVTVTRWTGCDQGTAVAFLAVDAANHAWMGSTGPARSIGPAYGDLDSSTTAWNFLIQHPRT